ncbi:hypothetical protein GCM10022384_07860 [Streptomyces marokkonensis]|uniref:HTH cro/C1-type domain-containing protein n=1 Tax=Streptomyces marokkonensis TaxID=324855 RepID=A0ABP7NZM2_9ACTN
MYRLNVTRLRAIAAQHGDKTPYAIAKRTGVSISSAYRYVDGSAQPDLNSALRLAQAYDLDIRTVMDLIDDEEDEPAGVAA